MYTIGQIFKDTRNNSLVRIEAISGKNVGTLYTVQNTKGDYGRYYHSKFKTYFTLEVDTTKAIVSKQDKGQVEYKVDNTNMVFVNFKCKRVISVAEWLKLVG